MFEQKPEMQQTLKSLNSLKQHLYSLHRSTVYCLLLAFIMTHGLWSTEFSVDDFQYNRVVLPCGNALEFLHSFFICYLIRFMLDYMKDYLVNEWCPI